MQSVSGICNLCYLGMTGESTQGNLRLTLTTSHTHSHRPRTKMHTPTGLSNLIIRHAADCLEELFEGQFRVTAVATDGPAWAVQVKLNILFRYARTDQWWFRPRPRTRSVRTTIWQWRDMQDV